MDNKFRKAQLVISETHARTHTPLIVLHLFLTENTKATDRIRRVRCCTAAT